MSVVATSNGGELCKAVEGDDVMAELCNCVVQSAWRHLEKSRCVVRAERVVMKRSVTQNQAASSAFFG